LVTIRKGPTLKKTVDKNSDSVLIAYFKLNTADDNGKNTPTTTSQNTIPTTTERVPGTHVFNEIPSAAYTLFIPKTASDTCCAYCSCMFPAPEASRN
jgi:hypothetical protein